MTASELPANGMTQTASSPYNLLLATFFAAILMSAALLFAVQPMFTKMVLPRLGGAAASHRQRMGPAAFARRGVLASRPVCGLDRAAILCSRRQWAAHAGVVRAHRPSFSARPVFPFCRKQCWKLSRAHLLSHGA